MKRLSTGRNNNGRLAVIFTFFLLVSVLAIGSIGVSANSDPGRMTVSGTAEIKVAPDIALFNIGMESRGKTLEEARSENAQVMEGVRERLIAAGAKEENLQTRGFQVYPEWYYDKDTGDRTLVGYRVTHSLEVIVTDLDVLGTWLDAAMSQGANQISGPTFGLRDSEKHQTKALEEAVRKARTKADVLARASGVFIKRIVQISENVSTPYGGAVQQRAMMQMESFADSASTSISPGEISITAYVSMTFEI